MDNLMNRLTYNLKRIRKERRIPYAVVERATGIRASKLQEAEDGEQKLSVDELERLLSFYQLTPDQVLRYKRISFVKIAAPVLAVLVIAVIIFSQTFGQEDDRESHIVANEDVGGSVVAGDGSYEGGAADPGAGLDGSADEAIDDLHPDSDEIDHSETADLSVDGEASLDEIPASRDDRDAGDTHDPSVSVPVGDASSDTAEEVGPITSPHDVQDIRSEEPGIDDPVVEVIRYGSIHPSETVDVAPLPVPVYMDSVVFRIWGNMPYHADELPRLEGNDLPNVKHIIPIEGLSAERPNWLDDAAKDRYILSLGNADIWTDTAVEEWLRLRKDGYPAIGLGRSAHAYEPYIVQVKDQKVGFLSLAGLIHEADHIAHAYWIGLPRAYDNEEVIRAVEQAKRQVDYLVVLIHAGYKRGDEAPIDKQERLARVAAEAGADIVIGNRSLRSQDITAIGDVPVFYSLGRSISQEVQNGLTNFVLDVHYQDGVDKIVAHIGTMQDGVVRFDGRSRDLVEVEKKFDQLREEIKIELEIDDHTSGG